jgi:hypothetical protein
MKIALLILLIIAILIAGPLLTIWALNTVFPVLNIPFSFWTWLAVIVLQLQLVYRPSK